jgi:Zn-dependent peptidase ImmA (M78 family)
VKCPVIVVKKMPAETRQVFTLLHELGDVLLHRKSFIDDAEDLYSHEGREKEANAFAGILLVPDEKLNEVDDDAKPSEVSEYDDWLRPLTRELGVSPEVVLRRLLDSDRIGEAAYRNYRTWLAKQPVPKPDELWNLTFAEQNVWRDRFAAIPFEDRGGYFQGRCSTCWPTSPTRCRR